MTELALTATTTAYAYSRKAVERRLQDLLDNLQITEFDYRQYEYSMPMTVRLVHRALSAAPPPAPVLTLAPHAFLVHALLAHGYQVDAFSLGNFIVPEDLEANFKGCMDPRQLGSLQGLPDKRYGLVVLPFVVEAVPEDIRRFLRALRRYLLPTAKIILGSSNLAKFGTRWRALLGKPFIPLWGESYTPREGGWPDLMHYRSYNVHEFAVYAHDAGYRVLDYAFVRGFHAFNQMIPLSIKKYLFLKGKVWLQRLAPPLRDETLVTLEVRLESGIAEGAAAAEKAAPAERESFPSVSIVVPTKNRGRMLGNCLRSLFAQSYPKERYELIVVNDGSTDDTAEVIASLQAEATCSMKVLTTPGLGTSGARNLGMREAQGEIVAHTDDDNELPTTWLEAAVSCFEPGVAIVSGPIVANPKQKKSFFGWSLLHVREDGTYPTSNIFYRRDVALSFGGFNENLRRNRLGRPEWGWDTDLAWRIKRKGYQTRYSFDAYAYNEVFELGLWRWLAEPWRACMLPGVLRIAPEVRRTLLIARLFFSRNTMYFDLGLVGAILSIWLGPLAWLLALPWTASMALGLKGDFWPPQRWLKLGAKLLLLVAAHSILLGALLWGGLRARRLVL